MKKYICNNADECDEFCKHKSIHDKDTTCSNKCRQGADVKCVEMDRITQKSANERSAGMGLERSFFTANGIDPDELVWAVPEKSARHRCGKFN